MFEFDEQSEYFVRVRGRMQGPFDEAKIRAMIERGRIGRHDQISVDGRHWERAGDWTELFSTRGERKVRQTHEMAATRAGSRHSHADPNDPSSGTSAEEQLWYYNDHDQQYGPLPLAELKQRLAEGEIDPEAYGWTDGMENWEPLSSLPALSSSLRAQPAAPAAPAVAAAPVASAGSEPAGGAVAATSSDSSFWLIITTILVTIVLVAAVAAGVVLFMQRQGDVEEPDSENAAPAGSQASPADDSKTPDATTPAGGDAKPAPKVAPQPKTPPKSAPASPPAKKTPAAKTTAGGGVSASEIYERAVKSVFTIVTDKGQGSGFLLAPQMVIVTNSHVIKDASRIEVFDNNRRSDSTAVLVRDDGRDLALLRLPMAFTNRAGLVVATNEPRIATRVQAIGTPRGQSFSSTQGSVSQLRVGVRIRSQTLLPGVKLIQTDTSISPGSSGGPLLDSNGEVVGVMTLASNAAAGVNNMNYAVSAKEIAAVVKRLPSPP